MKADTKKGNPVNHTQLKKYIAASAPVHCSDGWSFLSQAVGGHFRGDFGTARHMAYYAELRAAMALLATEGIGVFDHIHFVIDVTSARRVDGSMGTHNFTWLALEHWANLQKSSQLLGDIISAGGVSLSSWLNAFGASTNLRVVASSWLKDWGLDLKKLSRDQVARNEASYRPSGLRETRILSALEALRFVSAVWPSWEPAKTSSFEGLDRFLIRTALEKVFESITGHKVTARPEEYRVRITEAIESINAPGLSKDSWIPFLLRNSYA